MSEYVEVKQILPRSKWMDNSSTKHCYDCKEEIKESIISSGKSHCRLCGHIICKNKCARKYFVLHHFKKEIICKHCHDELQPQPTTAANNDSMSIQDMDNRLAKYYADLGKNYYDKVSGIGKFTQWCNENEFEAEIMNEELMNDWTECQLIDFDVDFPLNENSAINIKTRQDREKEIFNVLKMLYDPCLTINLDDFVSINNIENAMINTYKSYKSFLKCSMFSQNSPIHQCIHDKNILYFITISNENRNNLLSNIIDSYRRYINSLLCDSSSIDHWINNSRCLKNLDSTLKQTNINMNKIDNMIDKTDKNVHPDKYSVVKPSTNNNTKLDLASVIKIYPTRIAPTLNLNRHVYMVNDNIQCIVNWIGISCKFIEWLLKIGQNDRDDVAATPFMFDFIFLLKAPVVVYTDDQEDEYEQKKMEILSIKQITKYLDHNKCLSHSAVMSDDLQRIKNLDKILYEPFRQKMIETNEKYPQYQRFNMIVDRRERNQKNKVKVLMFDPPNSSSIPPDYFPENMFELSSKCMVPSTEKPLTSKSVANGQMLSFSYHVYAENEIKCYMYWMGQCHRFYPQDIIYVLPKMFDDTQRRKNDLTIQRFIEMEKKGRFNLQRMKCLKDIKFEQVYRAIHGLLKNEFPKRV